MGANNRGGLAKLGLWRLMLKLPAVRGRLQVVSEHADELDGLFEAYEEASAALERFQKQKGGGDSQLIAEYEAICSEIEGEVIQHLMRTWKQP